GWTCSATARPTATLVSMRSCGPLSLVGVTQRPHEVVVDGTADGRDDQAAVLVLQVITRERLHMQARPVGRHLDLARDQAEAVPQWLGYYQSTCLVDGCFH